QALLSKPAQQQKTQKTRPRRRRPKTRHHRKRRPKNIPIHKCSTDLMTRLEMTRTLGSALVPIFMQKAIQQNGS
ncbi:MAG: hypothetical protein ACK5RU_17515, partial [Hyphomonadaceae bacterium]